MRELQQIIGRLFLGSAEQLVKAINKLVRETLDWADANKATLDGMGRLAELSVELSVISVQLAQSLMPLNTGFRTLNTLLGEIPERGAEAIKIFSQLDKLFPKAIKNYNDKRNIAAGVALCALEQIFFPGGIEGRNFQKPRPEPSGFVPKSFAERQAEGRRDFARVTEGGKARARAKQGQETGKAVAAMFESARTRDAVTSAFRAAGDAIAKSKDSGIAAAFDDAASLRESAKSATMNALDQLEQIKASQRELFRGRQSFGFSGAQGLGQKGGVFGSMGVDQFVERQARAIVAAFGKKYGQNALAMLQEQRAASSFLSRLSRSVGGSI